MRNFSEVQTVCHNWVASIFITEVYQSHSGRHSVTATAGPDNLMEMAGSSGLPGAWRWTEYSRLCVLQALWHALWKTSKSTHRNSGGSLPKVSAVPKHSNKSNFRLLNHFDEHHTRTQVLQNVWVSRCKTYPTRPTVISSVDESGCARFTGT